MAPVGQLGSDKEKMRTRSMAHAQVCFYQVSALSSGGLQENVAGLNCWRTHGQTDGRTTPDGPVYDKLRRPPVTAELKSGISAFKMAARRPSWIGSTRFFVYRWALQGYILIPNLACLPYPIMKKLFPDDSLTLLAPLWPEVGGAYHIPDHPASPVRQSVRQQFIKTLFLGDH